MDGLLPSLRAMSKGRDPSPSLSGWEHLRAGETAGRFGRLHLRASTTSLSLVPGSYGTSA